jgi:hypothetical protein
MRSFLTILAISALAFSCRDNDVNLFDETADQRVADAVSSLKKELTTPPNGFKFNYQPEGTSGSFLVLAKFNTDNTVILKTDLDIENGKYYEDTITWRIDNSLGMELIFENYSFFSYLFEQDQATFQAEFEFLYVNKTPDNDLVFKSKTDQTLSPTIITFQQAAAGDEILLAKSLAEKISLMNEDLGKFSSSLALKYDDKDLVLYISNNSTKRIFDFTVASKKSNVNTTASVGVSTGYFLSGDSLVLLNPVEGTFFGNNIKIKSIKLSSLVNSSLNVCSSPINAHGISGATSSGDDVLLETSLIDPSGAEFTGSSFYYSPTYNLFQNGESISDELAADLSGVNSMQIYYKYDIGSGSPFYAIGFRLVNSDGSATFALRQFTPQLIGNNLRFQFAATISLFGNSNPDADVSRINTYLEGLAQGNQAYAYKLNEGVFEFYNPCSGYSFVFFSGN